MAAPDPDLVKIKSYVDKIRGNAGLPARVTSDQPEESPIVVLNCGACDMPVDEGKKFRSES
jgi:hypothetical protein